MYKILEISYNKFGECQIALNIYKFINGPYLLSYFIFEFYRCGPCRML